MFSEPDQSADNTGASPSAKIEHGDGMAIAALLLWSAIAVAVLGGLVLWRFGISPSRFLIVAVALAIGGLCLQRAPRVRVPAITPERWCSFAVFVLFLGCYSLTRIPRATVFDEPVRQAQAFLHGHVWVDELPANIESIHWQGHTYLLHPPLAAVLLTPLVALSGAATDQTAVAVVLGALEVALAWRLLSLLGLRRSSRLWLTIFFGLGTTVWYEATLGNSWDFVLLVAMGMNLIVLNEMFGKARPMLVGFLAGAAALARNDLFLVLPVYLWLLRARGRSWREVRWLAPGFVTALAGYAAFNLARFSPTIIDIALWIYDDPVLMTHGGQPFALRYLPYNLYTVLFMAPSADTIFPFIHPRPIGQAMVFTSPAFVLALRPSFGQAIVRLMLAACVLAMLPSLFVYSNGVVQFGARYYVQAYPFLLVLVALGVPEPLDQLTKTLILASIALVAFGLWHIRTIGWG